MDERDRQAVSRTPAEALAPQPQPLGATLPPSAFTSVFHTGTSDSPQVAVAFNRPVVDFAAATPSVTVSGASVSSHVVVGEAANAYIFTLTPTGSGDITFSLVANTPCDPDGICTADGAVLSEVPAPLVIQPQPTLSLTADSTAIAEADGGVAAITNGITPPTRSRSCSPYRAAPRRAGTSPSPTLGAGRSRTPFLLKLPSGQSSVTGVITAVNDSRDEGDETISVEATYAGATIGSGGHRDRQRR